MNKKGLTVIELLVVTTILGIMISMATIGYRDHAVKAGIEADTRQILAISLLAKQYSFTQKIDLHMNIDDSRIIQVLDEDNNVFNGLEYTTKNDFTIDGDISLKNGFVTEGDTIRVTGQNTRATYDCVIYETGRIKAGKMSDGDCNAN